MAGIRIIVCYFEQDVPERLVLNQGFQKDGSGNLYYILNLFWDIFVTFLKNKKRTAILLRLNF